MNNRICLIRQPSGLGDIFFSQKIAQMWIDGGYKVIWPVEDHYYDCISYLNSEIEFCPLSGNFIRKDLFTSDYRELINENGFVYLPLQYSFELLSGGVPYTGDSLSFLPREIHPAMQAKYYFTQIDYKGWVDYFDFTRNFEREDHLFYDVLGLKDDQPFSLINRNFAAGLNSTEEFSFVSDFPVLEMSMLDDVLLFDWCKVFEEAFEIHTVDTAVSFVIEKLPKVVDNLFVYKRTGYQSYEDLKLNVNMFNKPWNICGE